MNKRTRKYPQWVKSAALDLCQSLPVFLDKHVFGGSDMSQTCHKRKNAAALDRTHRRQNGYIGSISPGRQVLLNQGSSGPYSRKSMFQPFPGIVCTQFASLPKGAFGPK